MQILLDRGADIEATNVMGETALHCAAHGGSVDVIAARPLSSSLFLQNGLRCRSSLTEVQTSTQRETTDLLRFMWR